MSEDLDGSLVRPPAWLTRPGAQIMALTGVYLSALMSRCQASWGRERDAALREYLAWSDVARAASWEELDGEERRRVLRATAGGRMDAVVLRAH